MLYYLANQCKSIDDKIKNYNIVSFDLFDTLITRKCHNPHQVFTIVEEYYNKNRDVKISDFKLNRIKSEIVARKNKEEITLDDIYKELFDIYGVEVSKKLMEEEIKVEFEQCIRNEVIVRIYNSIIKQKRVIIISDMYHSEDFIVNILKINNIPIPEKIYVSSKWNKTKRTGSLFIHALNELECKSSEMIHIGDNIKTDFIRPKLLGISSFLIRK